MNELLHLICYFAIEVLMCKTEKLQNASKITVNSNSYAVFYDKTLKILKAIVIE